MDRFGVLSGELPREGANGPIKMTAVPLLNQGQGGTGKSTPIGPGSPGTVTLRRGASPSDVRLAGCDTPLTLGDRRRPVP
jgi:hypothetical protein